MIDNYKQQFLLRVILIRLENAPAHPTLFEYNIVARVRSRLLIEVLQY